MKSNNADHRNQCWGRGFLNHTEKKERTPYFTITVKLGWSLKYTNHLNEEVRRRKVTVKRTLLIQLLTRLL